MDKYLDNCGNCYFQSNGKCRRNPPVIVMSFENLNSSWNGDFMGMEVTHTTDFPDVLETNWCGEYKRGDGSEQDHYKKDD